MLGELKIGQSQIPTEASGAKVESWENQLRATSYMFQEVRARDTGNRIR